MKVPLGNTKESRSGCNMIGLTTLKYDKISDKQNKAILACVCDMSVTCEMTPCLCGSLPPEQKPSGPLSGRDMTEGRSENMFITVYKAL